MRALWMEGGKVELRELPMPAPGPGEALVRVELAGICATDLHLLSGYYQFAGVPGHEFVGRVAEASGAPEWVGRRVVGEINLSCGECEQCLAARPSHCERRSTLGIHGRSGAFAEYLCLPLSNLHRLPDALTDDEAVFAEPLAAALEIPQREPIRPADRVLLVGAGRLGQLIARVLKLSGCDLRVVARYPGQRRLLERAGIRWVDEQAVAERHFDQVVEATGSPGGIELAGRALRPRGRLLLKSTYKDKVSLDLSRWVVDEISVIGSRCGPFAPALRLLEQRLLDVRPLIDQRFALERAGAALGRAAAPGAGKVLLVMNTSSGEETAVPKSSHL